MPVDGDYPTGVPLPMGYAGSYSPDGARLAYEPLPLAFGAWKRYRGGRASAVWIANLSDSSVEKLPRVDSNDFNPMWVGDRVYFLSDRNGPTTLFAYDPASKEVKRLLDPGPNDIKSASACGDAIVYDRLGTLHLFDLKAGTSRPVPVR